jgi:hypothetical protein
VQLAGVFIIPLPLFLYYAVIFLNLPALQSWSDQAYTPSPNPLHYLLTYGFYLTLGILYPLRRKGARGRQTDPIHQVGREADHDSRPSLKMAFLWVWVGTAAVLLYLPLNSQRRYVEGLHIPFSILATIGFFLVVWPWLLKSDLVTGLLKRPRYSAAGLQRLTILALVAIAGLSNVYLYASTLIKVGVQQPYPLFRLEAELEAMAWLKERIVPGDVVLAGYRTGSYLPFRTGANVIVGNRYETADFIRKRQEAAQFFEPETADGWRQNLLIRDKIRYVFVGPEERRLGGESLAVVDYLEPIYQNEAVIIYQVQDIESALK